MSEIYKITKAAHEFYVDGAIKCGEALTKYLEEIEAPNEVKSLGFGNMLVQVLTRFAAHELGVFLIETGNVDTENIEHLAEIFIGNFKKFVEDTLHAHKETLN